MRGLFFVLLAVNVGLAVMTYLRDQLPNPDAQLVNQQMNADQIRIVPPRPVPTPVPIAAAPTLAVCLEWGRFGAADLPKAQSALNVLALGERVRRIDVNVSTSYWIYIAPMNSKSEMERKTNELKKLGVTGYSPILETGRWRYAIMLGAFRSEGDARKHLAVLRGKGVRSARIGEREQGTTQFAYLIRDPTESQWAQLVKLKTAYSGSELRAVDCPPS
jgi:hypothetical protein